HVPSSKPVWSSSSRSSSRGCGRTSARRAGARGMTDEAHFIEALRATPGDQALRLIYADWLEERGDPPADYLRLENEILRHLNDDTALEQLTPQLAGLLTKLDAAWIEETGRKCEVYLIECDPTLRLSFVKLYFIDEKLGHLREGRECVELP